MLKKLAQALKKARLKENESQNVFCLRVGIKLSTYRRMERGQDSDNGVGIGNWLKAIEYLGWDEPILDIVEPKPSLFEQAKLEKQAQGTRQRASKSPSSSL